MANALSLSDLAQLYRSQALAAAGLLKKLGGAALLQDQGNQWGHELINAGEEFENLVAKTDGLATNDTI